MDIAGGMRDVVVVILDHRAKQPAASVDEELRQGLDDFRQPFRLNKQFDFRDMRSATLDPDHPIDGFIPVSVRPLAIRGITPVQINLRVTVLDP